MDIKERLSFFQEMVQCEYPLHLWHYSPEFELIETDCPAELMLPDIISMLGFSSLVLAHIESGNRMPLILDTEFGLLWIAGFEYQGFALQQIHIVGPAFTGSNSHLVLRKKLDSYQLTVKLRSKIVKQIESVPIIPSSVLLSYAIMFHCAITGERITADLISFTSHSTTGVPDDSPLLSGEHPGIWMAEQTFLSMIREGNPEYKKALAKSMTLSSGVKAEIGDSLRMSKNNLLVLLTLCSRAAIDGGLNPSIAYTLNDYYAGRIEECKTTADTTNLSREFLDDYVHRVRAAKETNAHSRQIQNICDYISLHIREPLSISLLSERLGYTEYYFSHKFKEVTGESVNAYIRRKKIEEAKLHKNQVLLKIKGIDDINEAEKYRGCFIKIPREKAKKLPKDTYFIADLIGLQVYTDSGELLGKVDDIYNSGSADIYVVKDELGKQILLPGIKDVIKQIDVDNEKIIVHLIDGLI